jgi:hypothetical protein
MPFTYRFDRGWRRAEARYTIFVTTAMFFRVAWL